MDRKSYLELCELYLKTYSLNEADRINIYKSIVDLYDNSIPSMGSEDDATLLIGEPKALVRTFVTKFLENTNFEEEIEEDYREYNHYEKTYNNIYYKRKPNGFLVFLKISFLIFIMLCLFPFVLGWFGLIFALFIAASVCIFLPVFYIFLAAITNESFVLFFFFATLFCSGISFMAFYALTYISKYSFKACGKYFSFFKS